MSQIALALAGVDTLVAAGMWLSLRMAAAADLAPLPVSCRRRVRWWQLNSRGVYLGCGALALACLATLLPGIGG